MLHTQSQLKPGDTSDIEYWVSQNWQGIKLHYSLLSDVMQYSCYLYVFTLLLGARVTCLRLCARRRDARTSWCMGSSKRKPIPLPFFNVFQPVMAIFAFPMDEREKQRLHFCREWPTLPIPNHQTINRTNRRNLGRCPGKEQFIGNIK